MSKEKDIFEKIKDWHLKICVAILMLFSLLVFILGLRFEYSTQLIPWWFALIYGWSGLVVAIKLGDILYNELG